MDRKKLEKRNQGAKTSIERIAEVGYLYSNEKLSSGCSSYSGKRLLTYCKCRSYIRKCKISLRPMRYLTMTKILKLEHK